MDDDAWELVLQMTNPGPKERLDMQHVVEKLKGFAEKCRHERPTTCGACQAVISGDSRFYSQCGEATKIHPQHELLGEESTHSVLAIDSRMLDVLNAVRTGSIGGQEQALLILYQLGYDDGQRKLLYGADGVLELLNLVKNGRSPFIRVCVLDFLRWVEPDSKLPPEDLASLRGLPKRRRLYIVRVRLTKETSMIYEKLALRGLGRLATCIENCEIIARAEAIDPLLDLLRGGSNVQKEQYVWALSRLTSSNVCCGLIIDDEAISLFVELLRNGSVDGKLHAACALGNAAVIGVRHSIVTHGAVSPFVALLETGRNHQKDQAVRTLANLTVDKKNRAQITREEGILPLAKVLQDGTPCQTGQAARALANLAIDERNIDAITQAGAIPSLVSLLRGSNDKKDQATRALANLAFKPDSRSVIVNAGAVEPHVSLLGMEGYSFKMLAVRALANLALNAESRRPIANSGAVGFFVERLRDESDYQRSHAARALANLAIGEECHTTVIQGRAIPVLVTQLSCEDEDLKEKVALALAKFP
ncbi:hypothetical protein PC120_g10863 [Phytophthora cactorum]|nr:hypothetical protein PC120_g10863 [Phytophthora cactorum]